MAELVVEGSQLVVRLSWWERIAAVHGNVRVPLSSVRYTRVEARSGDALGRGRPFHPPPGTPTFDLGYGTRMYFAGKGFVAIRRRRPAVLVALDPPPSKSKLFREFSGLLVTVADPEATAERIMDAKPGHRGAGGKR